ncbi:MAG: hypothetical protein IKK29_03830 [Christensenellaceae bacterium]|nr:hypothetical protein [Christensenellaceae bacterium]
MRILQIIGIIIVLIGAVSVYFSAAVKSMLFGKKEKNENAAFDMKENIIKIVGVGIAIAGVLMVMYL